MSEQANHPQAHTTPATPSSVTRGLTIAVAASSLLACVVMAALVLSTGHSDWWPAFVASTIVAAVGSVASIFILAQAAGKPIEWLITIVMGATTARILISLAGLLISVSGLHTPASPTGFMICGYYAATLIVETTLLSRAMRGATVAAAGGTHV